MGDGQAKEMKYVVNIMRRSDGKTFTIEKDWPNDSIANLCYHWTDGNGGCDCNRCIYFDHKEDGTDPKVMCTCGDMEKYIAWIEVDGKLVVDERPLSLGTPRDFAVLYHGDPG